MSYLDETHDARLRSWVPSARTAETDFPLQNLPFGIFRRPRKVDYARIGVAIGDQILDLRRAVAVGAREPPPPALHEAVQADALNPLMSLGPPAARTLRAAIHTLLREDS